MTKIEVSRTELVWPGKYDDDGFLKDVPRVSLPFQVIETVNETRAAREARKTGIQQSLFDVWEGKEGDSFEAGWKNKLIWGDNLLVMASLLEKFAGKIDLIYIDPPFATGADFSFRAFVGDEEVTKGATLIEEKAYRDTWGKGLASFTQMLFDRFQLMQMLHDVGREPTPEELAAKLAMPLEKVREALKIAKEPISLETPIGDEEDSHLGDFFEDKNAVLPLDAAIRADLRQKTTRVLTSLTAREERVLRMRFGIGMNTDHTLEEVGRTFSVTRERIRQIEATALRKLKHLNRSHELRSFLGT